MKFEQPDYSDQTFEKCDESQQTIADKRFTQCKFQHCQFDEAKLLNCKFVDCEFVNCSLNNMILTNTSWNNVVFADCKIMGINWTQAKWPQIKLSSPLQFYSCNISHSSFFGLELVDIHIQECKAHDVDFREADLSSGHFVNTDFLQSQFNKTNLSHADFSDAMNYYFDVRVNNVKKASFNETEAVNLLRAFDIIVK